MKRLSIIVLFLFVLATGCIYLPSAPGTSGGTPQGQQPVITKFDTNPDSITAGSRAQLSWEVRGATSVSIDNGVGSVALSGSRTVVPATTTTYTITATNEYGTANATAQVLVSGSSSSGGGTTIGGAPVINSFRAIPDSVAPGGSSMLSWNVSNATSVSISPLIGSVNPVSGSGTVTVGSTTTFVLTATNSAGSMTANATVTVTGGTPSATYPTINSFTATPAVITAGGWTTIAWNVSGASQVTVTSFGPVDSTGSRTVSPAATTSYTLTATSASGSWVTQTITVAVGAAPVPTTPATTTTVYDFVAQASGPASSVGWTSGAGSLSFGGALDDASGFACYRTGVTLEDNNVYTKVLQTHPQWVDNGYISGAYFELYNTYAYKVLSGDRFYAKVGFIKGASAGKVKYSVMIRCEGGPNTWIYESVKPYDGTLKTINVDLSPYAGKKADFILQVSAEGSSGQDWAVWEQAKIIR